MKQHGTVTTMMTMLLRIGKFAILHCAACEPFSDKYSIRSHIANPWHNNIMCFSKQGYRFSFSLVVQRMASFVMANMQTKKLLSVR